MKLGEKQRLMRRAEKKMRSREEAEAEAEEGRLGVSLLLNAKRTCYGHDSPEISPV